MSAPPDVTHFRSHGVAGLRVWCVACHRHAVVSFETLRAAETDTIAMMTRRLKCSACGSKRVTAQPDWPPVRRGL